MRTLLKCPSSYTQYTWHNCFGTVSADGENLSVNSGMINPADWAPTPIWLTANMSVDGKNESGTDRAPKPLPMPVKKGRIFGVSSARNRGAAY